MAEAQDSSTHRSERQKIHDQLDNNRNHAEGKKARLQGPLLDDVDETDSYGNSTEDSFPVVKNFSTLKAKGQNVTSPPADEILPAMQVGEPGTDRPVAKQRHTEAKVKEDEYEDDEDSTEPRHERAKDRKQPEMEPSGAVHEASRPRKPRDTVTGPNNKTAALGLHQNAKDQDPSASPGETLAALAVDEDAESLTHSPNDQREGIGNGPAHLQEALEQQSASPSSKESDVSAGAGHALFNGNGSSLPSAAYPGRNHTRVSDVTGNASPDTKNMNFVDAAERDAKAQEEAADDHREINGRESAVESSKQSQLHLQEAGDALLHGNGSLPTGADAPRRNKTSDVIGDASGHHGENTNGAAAEGDAEAQEEAAHSHQEASDQGDVSPSSKLSDVSAGAGHQADVNHGNGSLTSAKAGTSVGRTHTSRFSNVTGAETSGDGKIMDGAAAEMDSQTDEEAVDDTELAAFENTTELSVVPSGVGEAKGPLATASGGASKGENLSDVRSTRPTSSSPPSPPAFPTEPKHGDDKQGTPEEPNVAMKQKGGNGVYGAAPQVESSNVDGLVDDKDKSSGHSSSPPPPPGGILSFKLGGLDEELVPMKRVSSADASADELRETKLRGHPPAEENGPKKTAADDDSDGRESDKRLQKKAGQTDNKENESAHEPTGSSAFAYPSMATPLPDILGIVPQATLDAEFRVRCSASFVDTHETMLLEDTAWIYAIIAGTAGKIMPNDALHHCCDSMPL